MLSGPAAVANQAASRTYYGGKVSQCCLGYTNVSHTAFLVELRSFLSEKWRKQTEVFVLYRAVSSSFDIIAQTLFDYDQYCKHISRCSFLTWLIMIYRLLDASRLRMWLQYLDPAAGAESGCLTPREGVNSSRVLTFLKASYFVKIARQLLQIDIIMMSLRTIKNSFGKHNRREASNTSGDKCYKPIVMWECVDSYVICNFRDFRSTNAPFQSLKVRKKVRRDREKLIYSHQNKHLQTQARTCKAWHTVWSQQQISSVSSHLSGYLKRFSCRKFHSCFRRDTRKVPTDPPRINPFVAVIITLNPQKGHLRYPRYINDIKSLTARLSGTKRTAALEQLILASKTINGKTSLLTVCWLKRRTHFQI